MRSALSSGTEVNVAELEALDREQCIDAWRRQFGQTPPKHISLQFMRKVLAYEAQVKANGGHSATVRKALARCSNGDRSKAGDAKLTTQASASSIASNLSLRPGTHLVREWNGRSYQVEVLEGGFQMDGKPYRSLSAIARKITGAHWSGPRFFGLDGS